ncbi:MAG: delta-60 repeat domain-containing protein [Patescibacteria group bacterium]
MKRKLLYVSVAMMGLVVYATSITNPAFAAILKPDTTFNSVGYVVHSSAAGFNGHDSGDSLQVQADGKYVVAGDSSCAIGNPDMAIWRYNPNGTLDTTFNSTGYITHNGAAGGNSYDGGLSLQIQADGKYVVTGYSVNAAGNHDMAIWRYNTNGTLDTTFNSTGYVTHNGAASGNDNDSGKSLQIQADGKYVVAGYSSTVSWTYDMAIWRYNTDGTLDTTFNSTGYVTHNGAAGGNSQDVSLSLQIQTDGKYVVAGYSRNASGNDDMAIWRYNPNGTLDTTFNSTGYVTHNGVAGGNGYDGANSLQIQADGKYIVAGVSSNASSGYDMAIWRYNPNGTLDTTFNSTGYLTHNGTAGGNTDEGKALQIQTDAKYVVAGYSRNASGNDDMAIWRYNTNGTLDTTFNSTGYVTHNGAAGGNNHDGANSLQIQTDAKYVVSGLSVNTFGNYDMAIWRYLDMYQIASLNLSLDVSLNNENIEVGEDNGALGVQILTLSTTKGILVARVDTDMYSDHDWSSVSAESNISDFKSYVHNLTLASGTSNTFTLYVPYTEGHNSVGICPGAHNLNEVGSDCEGVYYLNVGESRVSIIEDKAIRYWEITGVTDTGGFGYYLEDLPETGQNILLGAILFIGIPLFVARKMLKEMAYVPSAYS